MPAKYTPEKRIAAFWSKVDQSAGPNGCWNWTATLSRLGYGQVSWDSATQTAHRIAWMLTHGKILDGQCVCHRCDNPKCVNPGHLFLGTMTENMADRDAKGRRRSVEKHPARKLTDAEAAEIRRLYAQGGVTQRELGTRYKVTQDSIWAIVTGKTYKS